MIRRFIGMMIFTVTITMASFGQDVFGREHLISWAKQIEAEGPKHAASAMKKTDIFLSQLAPQAGVEQAPTACFLKDQEWSKNTYQS